MVEMVTVDKNCLKINFIIKLKWTFEVIEMEFPAIYWRLTWFATPCFYWKPATYNFRFQTIFFWCTYTVCPMLWIKCWFIPFLTQEIKWTKLMTCVYTFQAINQILIKSTIYSIIESCSSANISTLKVFLYVVEYRTSLKKIIPWCCKLTIPNFNLWIIQHIWF